MSETQTTPLTPASSPANPRSAFCSKRSRNQFGLFAAGVGFCAVSSIITRRSLVKRYKTTLPKFYQPSNRPSGEVNGALDAIDALSVATMNVCSISIMLSGGLLWAFDISTLNDIRAKVRPRIGVDVNRSDQDVEEEIEEWFATVLARKEFKNLHNQALKEKGKDEVKK